MSAVWEMQGLVNHLKIIQKGGTQRLVIDGVEIPCPVNTMSISQTTPPTAYYLTGSPHNPIYLPGSSSYEVKITLIVNNIEVENDAWIHSGSTISLDDDIINQKGE